MREMICRINDKNPDVNVLIHSSTGHVMWKDVAFADFYKTISKYVKADTMDSNERPRMLNPSIIALGNSTALIRQPEHKRIVLYANHSYNINFPSSVYLVHFVGKKITDIRAFTYFKWKDLDTALYKYPMPNMLTADAICMGTADRSINDGDIVGALERIIYAAYSHDSVDNIKGFRSTAMYFKYLKKQHLSYRNCISANLRLRSLVE